MMANKRKGTPYKKKERALRKSLLSEVWRNIHNSVEMDCERGEVPDMSHLIDFALFRMYNNTSLHLKSRFAGDIPRNEASTYDVAYQCAKWAGVPRNRITRLPRTKEVSVQMPNRLWIFDGSFVSVHTRYGKHSAEYDRNVRYIVPYLDSLMPKVESIAETLTKGSQQRAMIRRIELVTDQAAKRPEGLCQQSLER